VKVWKKLYQAKGSLKYTGVAIISDKVEFKPRVARKEKKRLLYTNKRSNTSRGNNNH
jgi:hypothetical protein